MNPIIHHRKNYNDTYDLILDMKKEIDQGHDFVYMPDDLVEYWYCEKSKTLYAIFEFDLWFYCSGFPKFPSGPTRKDYGGALPAYIKEHSQYIDKLLKLKAFA
jgi:hypothetical protein